jgi:ABC-type transport system involved in multi-copper enzyme maturation permease subunit
MRRIGVIAVNTFRENLRDKILYNLLFFGLLLMGGSVLLADLSIMEHRRIVTDMGLATMNLAGVIIAAFVGIGLVGKEIERRTVYTILARPISRTEFILGKYLGLVLTLFVNVAVMLAVFLGTLWMYRTPLQASLFQVAGLIFVELLLVTALALFFSTFSTTTLSAIMTLGVYLIGHLTTDLKGLGETSQNAVVHTAVAWLYYLCPNLEMLNIKGQASGGGSVEAAYVAVAALYGLLYAALLLTAACAVFRNRDF